MYDFTDKYICLVLTCNKPAYNERREKNMHIYSQIKKAGFEIVFLYASNENDSFHIKMTDADYYELTVPTEETYMNLINKMGFAYKFFNTQNVKGVLKIDDDLYYIDDEILDKEYYRADYLGLKWDGFFNGPFYWVSKKAIIYISNNNNIYDDIPPSAEDVYVGRCLSDKKDIKRYKTKWYEMGYVKYGSTCILYNSDMNTPEYCGECSYCKQLMERFEKKGIVSIVGGGLGNQIFQVCAGYIASLCNKCEFYLLDIDKTKNIHNILNID